MTTAILAPTLTFKSWLNNGTPNANGTVQTQAAGTTTNIVTYTDSTAATNNANPITLNARGECSLWLLPNVGYKFIEKDASGALIKTTDQVTQQQLITLYGGTDTGAVNAYILSYNAPYGAYQDGIAIYWTPAHTNTGPSTINVSFNNGSSFAGVVNIVNQDGSALATNEIIANQLAFILYQSGQFILTSPFATGGIFSASGFNATGATIPQNGMYLPASQKLGLTSNGVQRITINGNGEVVVNAPSAGITMSIYEQLNAINAEKTVATYETGTFTGTLTGCTTSPTATFNYSRSGNLVSISCSAGLTATSNANTCSVTGLPAAISPTHSQTMICTVEDSGVNLAGSALISAGSTTITLGLGIVVVANLVYSIVGFTAAGTKGLGSAQFCITYQLT